MSAETEAPPAAQPAFVDEIRNMLTRVYPGEVEAGELEEEVGCSPEELREAVKWMTDNGLIDTDAEQFKITVPPEGAAPGLSQHEAPGESELDEPSGVDTKAATRAPASGELPVRVAFSLSTSIGRTSEESDDAVLKRVEALFEQIQEALGGAMPMLEMSMDVQEIETFDRPRRIFPPEK